MPGFEIIDKKEKQAVNKLFDESSILMAHGFENIRKNFHVRSFEKNFSKKIKSKYALAVSSGTAAIKIALKAINIKPGDEFIAPSYTFVSTINAFMMRGGIPKFVDIRSDTLNIDENLIEKSITKKTKAIVVVHYAGVACEMKRIIEIGEKYKIPIIEDNAHGLFAKYNSEYLGTLGDFSTTSFHETKNERSECYLWRRNFCTPLF